jgi:hypothetical protein
VPPSTSKKDKRPGRPWYSRITRDIVLFVGGLLGVAHETLLGSGERPFLLAIFGGMLGLPVFLRRDENSP